MEKYNIKKVIYSTDDGSFITEKPERMDKLHISSGWKNFKKFIYK